ncbi:nucleolar protein dao-5 isoform X1 [Dendroctonus ponderosae]|uniref:nucleolar protein dao-5 isoform X1 n=1 Tax=Dendroctonus ponderosae TaxID=77166 RepID=UPI002035D902|nr:nucleolar protein dao-5 isoform X1 [Dendroctonus ponderosae]
MRPDAIVHGNLDVVVVSAGLICDRCGKKKTMEVYPRSSWFLLLLGFALIAATLQETTDCPTSDQVSCTSGIKCNQDEDCQSNEICCANPCYTKRCIPVPKGVQGEADTDGPSETDCRPYIEKALKELEIGEAGHVQNEPSDKDESAEDVPTVEITDDSSRQVDVDGEGGASDQNDGPEDKSAEQDVTQQEAARGKSEENDDDSGEAPDEKVVNKSEENAESDEETKTSIEQTEAGEQASVESESVEEQQNPEDAASAESEEQVEAPEPSIVKREAPVDKTESTPVQASAVAASQEGPDDENPGATSVEEAQEAAESQETDGAESAEAVLPSTASSAGKVEVQQEAQSVESIEEAGESEEDKKREQVGANEENDEPSQEDNSDEQATLEESAEDGGCPPPNKVSCIEGELCTKHRHCGENQICCPNKCYRRRCTAGTVPQAELDAESASEESDEAKSEETLAPSSPETGCPSPNEVSCTEGDLCSKHGQCGENHICCPNKCYRKRCTPGTATSAELLEESEEDSKEESEQVVEKPDNKLPDTGCPAPSEVSCVEGDLCSKHKHCGQSEICCPNKCYRKRCTAGTPTVEDLEDEEVSEESREEETKGAAASSVSKKDTGCPERDVVPCGGEPCVKNKHCGTGEICCANKCYRKVCVEGTPGSDEEDEESEEELKEQQTEESVTGAAESEEDDSNCPSPAKVSCTEGERCGDDDDCSSREICCPNKCYNKRCIPGSKKDQDVSEEKPPVKESKPTPKVQQPAKVEVKKETKPKAAPVPSPAPKPSPPPPKKEVKKPEAKKPLDESTVVFKPVTVVEPLVEEDDESLEKGGEAPVEELSLDTDIPTELRSREHVEHLLKLDQYSTKTDNVQNKVYEETLKELKRLYENAIKPLEGLYKYRDLSNRHFGDAEIFSKPLILFMGPWSGGKSSIINYLTNNEFNETALRTGAEPSPAYFNILMYGEEPEIIDGTELAADFTFSGLQKFGQGLEERLRGVKLPSKLLEKVNIVEIPGILEVRKQVSRLFPFNDACQWFIDRADIIFLVYDPSKLDVGPETEAILDQLKGREHQTRIILNKADQVKPEELMRVQGALIWNISPLMSSPQPPVMYTTSLWSRPFEPWAPVRLLQAQERAFLRDLRTAVDRRVENKIASARRFAVRVRNHAKMVDCYLTTYYNHKSVFGNRKQVANEIIERPQDYHIYEGLSTLTNISRYDLPDPDVYRDFFKLNPLYEFQQLAATCTYFRGCPINRLDIAIAYDLPELVGTYKRNLEEALTTASNPPKEPTTPPKKNKKSAPGS